MSKWKKININTNKIKVDGVKAILIEMPKNSDYPGYSFWHPQKLMGAGKHDYAVSLAYTDEFVFHLKKYGKGKINKFKVLDEIEIDAEEFEEQFAVMNENIREGGKI